MQAVAVDATPCSAAAPPRRHCGGAAENPAAQQTGRWQSGGPSAGAVQTDVGRE
jgi:hypothetical protein